MRVTVEVFDPYGRVLSTVSCGGRELGEWLLRSVHAIAGFDNRYQDAERAAGAAEGGDTIG